MAAAAAAAAANGVAAVLAIEEAPLLLWPFNVPRSADVRQVVVFGVSKDLRTFFGVTTAGSEGKRDAAAAAVTDDAPKFPSCSDAEGLKDLDCE